MFNIFVCFWSPKLKFGGFLNTYSYRVEPSEEVPLSRGNLSAGLRLGVSAIAGHISLIAVLALVPKQNEKNETR